MSTSVAPPVHSNCRTDRENNIAFWLDSDCTLAKLSKKKSLGFKVPVQSVLIRNVPATPEDIHKRSLTRHKRDGTTTWQSREKIGTGGTICRCRWLSLPPAPHPLWQLKSPNTTELWRLLFVLSCLVLGGLYTRISLVLQGSGSGWQRARGAG